MDGHRFLQPRTPCLRLGAGEPPFLGMLRVDRRNCALPALLHAGIRQRMRQSILRPVPAIPGRAGSGASWPPPRPQWVLVAWEDTGLLSVGETFFKEWVNVKGFRLFSLKQSSSAAPIFFLFLPLFCLLSLRACGRLEAAESFQSVFGLC